MRYYKSNFFGICLVISVLVFLSSCGDKKKKVENYFKIGEQVHEIKSGCILNNGQLDSGSDFFKIDLRLYTENQNDFINFGIVSQYAEMLSDATYSLNSSDVNASWVLGYNQDGSYSSMGTINTGTVVVGRTSEGYVIEINGVDQYNNAIEGKFKGQLNKTDVNNIVHQLPDYVCPDEIYNELTQYFPIFSGVNPPNMTGEYVSSPNVLIYESYAANPDTVLVFSDRYLGFIYDNKQLNFYGKQYDSSEGHDIEEIFYGAKITGDNDKFTCYFVVDGYVDGFYAQQSFIFSGKKTEEGLEDYHSAVVLLETSGHPNMPPKNSYRVLKDLDGLAEVDNWMSKSRAGSAVKIDNDELFKMWMK